MFPEEFSELIGFREEKMATLLEKLRLKKYQYPCKMMNKLAERLPVTRVSAYSIVPFVYYPTDDTFHFLEVSGGILRVNAYRASGRLVWSKPWYEALPGTLKSRSRYCKRALEAFVGQLLDQILKQI